VQRKREQFLLFRIRAFQDEAAFAALLEKHGSGLQRFLYFKLPTQPDVEDAYSTVCLRIWEYISRTPVDHFSALLHTIARGVVAEYYRRNEGKEQVPIETEQSGPLPIESKDSGMAMEQFVDAEMMKKALVNLGDDDREAIIMRFLEGFSVKEIARHLGKTENATSVMIHRALKKLRSLMERNTNG